MHFLVHAFTDNHPESELDTHLENWCLFPSVASSFCNPAGKYDQFELGGRWENTLPGVGTSFAQLGDITPTDLATLHSELHGIYDQLLEATAGLPAPGGLREAMADATQRGGTYQDGFTDYMQQPYVKAAQEVLPQELCVAPAHIAVFATHGRGGFLTLYGYPDVPAAFVDRRGLWHGCDNLTDDPTPEQRAQLIAEYEGEMRLGSDDSWVSVVDMHV